MSRRKLFRVLLFASTFVLAVAAWHSLLRWSQVLVNTPAFNLNASLLHGSLQFEFFFPGEPGVDAGFSSNPLSGMEVDNVSEFRWITDFARIPPEGNIYRRSHFYTAVIPLWLPYLAFIALSYTACRLMEKRSASGKEKELAQAESVSK